MPDINVLLVGTGALGSIYAWRLQEGGIHVTCVCRSNYTAVKSSGFRITSDKYGNHTYMPTRVVQSVDEAADTEYDFIIVCTKALPNISDNSHIIAPAIGPRTIILLIQNGIGIEQPFAERYPRTPIASVISYIDVSQPESGTIEHGTISSLLMGIYSNPDDLVRQRLDALSSVWNEQGALCKVVDDVQPYRWLKLVWNASFNTVSVVSGGNNTREMLDNPQCKELLRNIMREVYAIGEAATGKPLPERMGISGPDGFIEETDKRDVAVVPSMLMDYRARRPMEHDVILGRPLQVARQMGISAPYMEAVYAMLVMVEKTNL
ncbi:hypothetical protein LPJ77_002541 [Coemansia sp. RSA 2523]|nr:hypothetical protein LPJ58_000127 [Coemansia sp. RSA 1591]KAJ1768352.1 hypothetical protein LPJ69_000097 [Coemansia sp. RSA 1752]KAJ1777890.1 hypothetical protein LPJ54_002094 [Coemansia sp. RSA 1824]KAJ1795294.1 hypothetical protein LPJ67_000090 [Coemansia sp. RSA 1938]KAJ1808164.1 hypothetical protein LPJ77_002541 [Coemansia sp. RSA 2523]KAJ2135366.1 hypothetical protein GGH17_002408 [Coemansia sp. RSA 788]KAJ2155275.1 hypothetical protein J3F82_000576 [Coemansia sp. RSA 637]KAJ2156000.